MLALLLIGLWLVLQPTLDRAGYDLDIRVGSTEIFLERADDGADGPAENLGVAPDLTEAAVSYRVVAPPEFAGQTLGPAELDAFLADRIAAWESRPAFARLLLGFFNVSGWSSFGWVALGLCGQGAFLGRMLIQWIVSERSRVSTVPSLFWWLSLMGGVTLFVYFVWRKDVVGVLGQSTGIVIYARNLRLIRKQLRRLNAEAVTIEKGTA
jgi:lipid-A-disaccharide synthase-like uncharacterized protein